MFKISFHDRSIFEKSFHFIVACPEIRLNSAGNLDIAYADMVMSFSDKYHFHRAVLKLKEKDLKENKDFELTE